MSPATKTRLLPLALAALALAAYAPALRAGFVFDDHGLVERSALLQGPLWKLWLTAEPRDYWPLTWTSFWLERRLWGGAPLGYHLVNVALHATSAVLLWRVLAALAIPGAWLAGALFAVHPAAVESVAWISERKNTLSGALFLAAILVFVRHLKGGGWRPYGASLALFAAALLAKGSVVMLPVVLAGIVLATRRRLARDDALRLGPFFLLALAGGLVTVWFQWIRAMPHFMVPPRGLLERIAGAGWALASYLEKAYLPVRLAFFYPPWPVPPASPVFWAPLAAIAAGAALLLALRRHPAARAALLGLGYHAVMTLPILGLVDIVFFAFAPVSNHLQYLALAGPAALCGAALAAAGRRRSGPAPVVAGAAAAALLLVLGWTTARRAAAFESDVTLFRAAVREAPEALQAHWQLSVALSDAGDEAEAREVLDRAAASVRDPAERHHARALALLNRALLDEAIAEVEQAERLRPVPSFVRDVAMQLVLGGEPARALRLLEPALRRYPRYVDFHYWTAAALSRQGRRSEALRVIEDGLRVDPRNEMLRTARSVLLAAGR